MSPTCAGDRWPAASNKQCLHAVHRPAHQKLYCGFNCSPLNITWRSCHLQHHSLNELHARANCSIQHAGDVHVKGSTGPWPSFPSQQKRRQLQCCAANPCAAPITWQPASDAERLCSCCYRCAEVSYFICPQLDLQDLLCISVSFVLCTTCRLQSADFGVQSVVTRMIEITLGMAMNPAWSCNGLPADLQCLAILRCCMSHGLNTFPS